MSIQDPEITSRHLLNPEFDDLLDLLPDGPLEAANLNARRELTFILPKQNLEGGCSGVDMERLHFPGARGSTEIEVLFYRPKGDAAVRLPVYLHMHGGGFVLGTPEMTAVQDMRIAQELNCAVASVRYRLAPEVPYPGPIDDCHEALRGLWRDADKLGIDRTKIAIGGQSAGGGLAAALALRVRDSREMSLALQLLISPMLDDRTGSDDDPNLFAGEFVWTRASNRFGWRAMLGSLADSECIPYDLAPSRATDLAGLPPTFMYTGALDLFVDENLEYVRRLIRAGVPSELHIYPGAVHGFNLATDSKLAAVADGAALEALRRAFATVTPTLG